MEVDFAMNHSQKILNLAKKNDKIIVTTIVGEILLFFEGIFLYALFWGDYVRATTDIDLLAQQFKQLVFCHIHCEDGINNCKVFSLMTGLTVGFLFGRFA